MCGNLKTLLSDHDTDDIVKLESAQEVRKPLVTEGKA